MFACSLLSCNKKSLVISALSTPLLLATFSLITPPTASCNPDHSAGDYFVFANADGDGGSDDPKVYEPVCDDANDK